MKERRAKALAAARQWVVESRIQVRDHRKPARGAFNAWYDLELQRHRFVYPEITGYGITTLLFLNRQKAEPSLLRRAVLAGNWVIRRAMHANGGIHSRDYYDVRERAAAFSYDRHLVMTFDSGMVLFGLTSLYRALGRPHHLAAARKIGKFLVELAQKPDGLFKAGYSPEGGWPDDPGKWSMQPGGYHAKNALGLIDLWRVTGETRYRDAAERVCEASLKLQRPSGRVVCYRKSRATHLHPHMYTAEGWLYAGVALQRKDFLRAASKAAQWALSVQLPDGGLPCVVDADGRPNINERSDTLAQTLRMASQVKALGLWPSRLDAKLDALEERLLSYQCQAGPQQGGFYYGREMSGTARNHVNFWCTAFALQALAARQALASRERLAPDLFV